MKILGRVPGKGRQVEFSVFYDLKKHLSFYIAIVQELVSK